MIGGPEMFSGAGVFRSLAIFGLGMQELLIIFGIIILLFGAKKIPEIARSMGKGIKEFKKAGKEITDDIEEVTKDQPKDE